MRRLTRVRVGAASLATALLLAACTTIPSSGPVNTGSGVVATAEASVPIAEGPRVDDSPEGIVSGFVKASSTGFVGDFTVARDYLTPAASTTWDPTATVVVFDSGAIDVDFDSDTNTVTYEVPVLATLDDSGRLTEAADGTRETLTFTMIQDDEGQWRIANLEDGTLLASAIFGRLFTQTSLIFASVDETTQVPELRWLPRSKVETLAARELIEGPSEWLAPAVHTGFPATSALAVSSVVIENGEADVQLTEESLGSVEERNLAFEQMRLTLTSIPGISSVAISAGGVPVTIDNPAELRPAPLPSTDAAAFVGGRLGIFDGEQLWRVTDEAGGLPEDSAGLAQTFGTPTAAWIVGGSELVTSDALAGGVAGLENATRPADAPATPMDTVVRHRGDRLVAPSADRHSWLWTAERSGPDELVAIKTSDASALLAIDWLRGTSLQAMAVSHDGARIAVLSRNGGKQVLEVASIVRDADGSPLSVGQPLTVGVDLGPSIDLVWVDELTLAVLGEPGGEVQSDLWLAVVGGLTDAQKSVTHAVDITALYKERSLLVVDADGAVYSRSGTVWAPVAVGADELAYSG